MPSYAPGRPPNEKDLVQSLSGMPIFLGSLLSTGGAVNNITTAVPFATPALNPPLFKGTLAGRVLLLQPTADGFFLGAADATITVVAQGSTISLVPPLSLAGVRVGANERVIVTMPPDMPVLQWISASGSASLFVWEMY